MMQDIDPPGAGNLVRQEFLDTLLDANRIDAFLAQVQCQQVLIRIALPIRGK